MQIKNWHQYQFRAQSGLYSKSKLILYSPHKQRHHKPQETNLAQDYTLNLPTFGGK